MSTKTTKWGYLFFFTHLTISLFSQIQSNCTPPSTLLSLYEADIKNMAIRRMEQVHSGDTAYIIIPQAWQDTIQNGLAAILNSSLLESDTVFNKYCIHDQSSYPRIAKRLIVSIDPSYTWTSAWMNLNPITGNSSIDNLVNNHGLTVLSYNQGSFHSVILQIPSFLNNYALADSLSAIPGINWVDPDFLIGALAGRITFDKIGSNYFFDFSLEWNDCFDGCDNTRTWTFKVDENCVVNYLGFNDFGFFGIQPLPAPTNCNSFMTTDINSQIGFNSSAVSVYPNPFTNIVKVKGHNIKSTMDSNFNVFNLMGELVLSGICTNDEMEIDLSALQTGTYFLVIGNSFQNKITLLCDKSTN